MSVIIYLRQQALSTGRGSTTSTGGGAVMVLLDGMYFVAYGAFLLGAAFYVRNIGESRAYWIMAVAVALDFFATVIPSYGFKSVAIGIGSSVTIITAIALGVVVWCLFLGVVFLRLVGKHALSSALLTVITIAWFIDLVLFLKGVYGP